MCFGKWTTCTAHRYAHGDFWNHHTLFRCMECIGVQNRAEQIRLPNGEKCRHQLVLHNFYNLWEIIECHPPQHALIINEHTAIAIVRCPRSGLWVWRLICSTTKSIWLIETWSDTRGEVKACIGHFKIHCPWTIFDPQMIECELDLAGSWAAEVWIHRECPAHELVIWQSWYSFHWCEREWICTRMIDCQSACVEWTAQSFWIILFQLSPPVSLDSRNWTIARQFRSLLAFC